MRMASRICQSLGTVWGMTPVMTNTMAASSPNRMYMVWYFAQVARSCTARCHARISASPLQAPFLDPQNPDPEDPLRGHRAEHVCTVPS